GFAWLTLGEASSQFADGRPVASTVGSQAFGAMAFFQLALISLFAPALAAGAISGERERQTFDVLLVSRVSAFGIVWGKLVASLAYLVLLILTALPLFAAVFLFGGIDFEQFVLAHVLTIMTALSIGAVSLFWSALFRRSLPATVTSYATTFFLVVGTFVAGLLLTYIYAFRDGVAAASNFEFHPLAYGNPLFAMYVVLASPSGAPVHRGRRRASLPPLPGRPGLAGAGRLRLRGSALRVGGLAASLAVAPRGGAAGRPQPRLPRAALHGARVRDSQELPALPAAPGRGGLGRAGSSAAGGACGLAAAHAGGLPGRGALCARAADAGRPA